MAEDITYAQAGNVLEAVRVLEALEQSGEITPRQQEALNAYRAKRPAAEQERIKTAATYRGVQSGLSMGFDDEIRGADLVVSHAGAGSVFETLRAKKPLLVVVNDALMGNHQQELAETLHEMGHLRWCAPEGVGDAIAAFDETSSKPYQPGDPAEVQRAIRSMLLRR